MRLITIGILLAFPYAYGLLATILLITILALISVIDREIMIFKNKWINRRLIKNIEKNMQDYCNQ